MSKEDGIGTGLAKEQHQARRDMAKVEEKEIMSTSKLLEQERMDKGGTNFALYNFILTTTDFTVCKAGEMGNLAALQLMFTKVMIHMDRVCGEAAEMAEELGREFNHPTDLATTGLEAITKAARDRAKVNKYIKGKEVKIYS